MLGFLKTDSSELLYKELLKDYVNDKKVQKLIDSGVNINRRDSKGRTFLFDLVNKKRVESIKILVKNGINVNDEDNFGKTVLSEAVNKNDKMMIRFLLGLGASVNFVNSSGRTILQDVALEANAKIFEMLLSHNADLNIIDNYGRNVLFDAVEGGDLNILNHIINNIDDINTVDNKGRTALFIAVLKENSEAAKFLITHGIDINITDKKRQNVLFNAVILGSKNLDLIELMIDKKIKLNVKDNSENTLLDEILKIDAISKDLNSEYDNKYRLVNENRNYLKLTTILIDHGLAVDRRDESGKTVLYKEVESANYDTIKFLMTSGADINAEDNDGKTVFFDACMKGLSNLPMIEFLINNGIDIEKKDLLERTIIDDLCEIVLIQQNNKRATSRRILDYNAEEDYFALLKRLLILKPKLNTPKSNGRTVIFDLVTHQNLDLLKLLISAGADLNIVDNEGTTPLSLLIDEGLRITQPRQRELFLERIVFLLKFRMDVDTVDKDGKTIYHKVVLSDDLEVVEKLLTKKANLNIKDKQGRTALHHTQWKGNYKIARLLIASGANMDEADYAGFTILNYAAILGHTKLVSVLIASGVLMYNKAKKSKAVSQFFLEKAANLDKLLRGNITDEKMRSAITQVVSNLKKEIKEALK